MNGEPYPEPQYYVPRKNNIGKILTGVTIAGIAGGYLYFAYQNGWWPFTGGGIWDPQPGENCTGACNFNGSKRCKGNDLCQCTDNQWTLFESGSSICGTGATTHLACFNSQNGIITCVEDAGPGTDQCYALGYSGGCPCDIQNGVCDQLHWCNPVDNRCIEMADNYFVSGNQTGTQRTLTVPLNEPFAANRMSYCRIDYAGGGFAGTIFWSFWGLLNGNATKICEGNYLYSGGTGYFWIPANVAHELPWAFPVQGFDEMQVQFGVSGNEYPQAFQGTFDFG